jgi:hypothetical protein
VVSGRVKVVYCMQGTGHGPRAGDMIGVPADMIGVPARFGAFGQDTGVNDVEQFAAREPADAVTSTVTVYPGVAPLM